MTFHKTCIIFKLFKKLGLTGGVKMLNENIRMIIDNKGLKHCAVAAKAGYSKRMFSDILCGRKVIKADDIERICNALEITPNDVFGIK